MLDSIHTYRWLFQFRDSPIDFRLFPSSPHRRIRPELHGLISTTAEARFSIASGGRWFALPLWLLDKVLGNFFRSFLLRSQIQRFKPDFVHALELQQAGYLLSRTLLSAPQPLPRIISTNWGSDIYWFGQYPKHRKRISKLLGQSDFYSAECNRDVDLARDLGFKGIVLPVIPNAGGFEDGVLQQSVTPVLARNVIAIKGYHGWVGRAKVALGAIEQLSELLVGMEIVLYSANLSVVKMAGKIARRTGLSISVYKKGELSHSQMLDLFASSRVYVGISMSDGISTSLLESMAMGAIPVQTSTSCCDEWFSDSGVAVTEISESAVAEAIQRALKLAENQSNSDRNREIIRQKANASQISLAAKSFYVLD